MAKHGLFNKKVLAILIALTFTAGTPFSVYATDVTDSNVDETTIETEEKIPEAEEIEEEGTATENVGEERTLQEILPETSDVQAEVPNDVQNDIQSEDRNEDHDIEESEPVTNVLYVDADPVDTTAAEESTEADGCIKITTYKKPQNVVSMVLPIISSDSYSFILDPDGLLAENPDNTVIGEGSTVFFKTKDRENTYSIYADVATAVNKSSLPVKFSVDLKINNFTSEPIAFADLNEVMNSEVPSICFAIVPTEAGIVAEGKEIVPGAPVKSEIATTDALGLAHKEIVLPSFEENFEVETYESDIPNYYIQKYVVKDEANWSTAGFTLYAACSKDADWSSVAKSIYEGGKLSLTLTYRMEPIIEDDDE